MLVPIPAISHRMRRRALLAALLIVTLFPSVGFAQKPFAALTVEANGRQQYDLTTGVTTMPDGGVITDLSTGVHLEARSIVYLAGAYVEATGASVEGSFGRVTAGSLHLDLVSGVLSAAGELQLVREGLLVTAGALNYDASIEVAEFSGGVTSLEPEFRADRVLLDVRSGDVLLTGEYDFHDTLFTLVSPEGGGRLELRFVMVDGVARYDVATEVRPELLERFAHYL